MDFRTSTFTPPFAFLSLWQREQYWLKNGPTSREKSRFGGESAESVAVDVTRRTADAKVWRRLKRLSSLSRFYNRTGSAPGTVRKQSRHPTRCQRRREGKTKRRTRTVGYQDFLFEKCSNGAPSLSIAGANHRSRITPRQLSTIEHCFQDPARLGREMPEPGFFLRPQLNARS